MTLSFLYGLLFLGAWRLMRLTDSPAKTTPASTRPRWPAALIAVALASSAGQLLYPGMEPAWRRSASAIDGGELWRLGTSFLVQGGGAWGMGFNLITLVVTVLLAARVLPAHGLGEGVGPVLWVFGGVAGNLAALAFGYPDGSGSSLATMTLAVATAVLAVRTHRDGSTPARAERIGLVVLAAAALGLVVLRDEHAIAVVLGLLAGLALRRGTPDRIVLGAACYASAVTFFVGQAVAQVGVTNGYSPIRHMVSDLGMVGCDPADVGPYHTDVCSPWHLAMNLGFAATGFALLTGTVLLRPLLPPGRLPAAGAMLVALGGIGKIGAGLTPGDLRPVAHMAVAVLSGPTPTIGLVLLGISLRATRPRLARVTVTCGAVGLVGFALTSPAMSGGWAGLAERIAMYPSILWVIGVGIAILASRSRATDREGTVVDSRA